MATIPSELQVRPAEAADLQEQVLRLTQEKRDLEEYAERVTRELRRYQQARPAPSATSTENVPLPPWAMNMQMMSPLLFSYEERIAELESVIERSTSLAEQAQALAKENDSLRVELQERTEQLRRSQLVPAPREPNRDGSTELEELQELYRLSVEQVDALAQQNQLLKVQLERLQQTIVAGQHQAREVHGRAVEAGRAFTAEQERAEAFAQQRATVEKRLETVNGELVEEIRVRDELQRECDGLQRELHMQSQSLEMLKQNLEERCALAVDEEERLRAELERVTKNDREQRQKIATFELDLAKVSEQYATKKREADATKQEADRCVREMDVMLRKLTDISERHDEVRRRLADQETKAAELLLEKERLAHIEAAAQRTVERLQCRLQSEVDTFRQQRDLETESLRSAHTREKETREEKFRKSEQEVATLQMKVELFEKQRSWEAAALENHSSVHSAERARLQNDIDEAHQARLRLERQVGVTRSEAGQLRTEMEATVAETREQCRQVHSEVASYRTKVELSEVTLGRLREELQVSELRAGQGTTDVLRLKSELQEERSRGNEETDREKRKVLAERRALERQVQSMAAKSHQGEQRAMDLLRAQEMLEQQWKAEYVAEKGALEGEKERLFMENRTLREKSRGLLKALAVRRLTAGSELGGEDFPRLELLPFM